MSKKVLKIANLLFPIGIVFMFICLTTSIKINTILPAILIVFGVLIITKLLYKNSFFEKLSKDKKLVMFIYFFVICVIELLMMVNHFSLVLLFNCLIIDFSLLVTYLFVRRTGGNEEALLVIPGSLLFLPYLLENATETYLLSSFVPISLIYLILSFDYTAMFRKKNLLRLAFLAVCLVTGIFLNNYTVSFLLLFMYAIYQKKGGKKAGIVTGALFILTILSFIVKNIINLKITTNINYDLAFYLFFIATIILLIFAFLARINRNYLSSIRKEADLLDYSLMLAILVAIFTKNEMLSTLILTSPLLIIYYTRLIAYKEFSLKHSIVLTSPKENIKKVSVVIPNYNYANYICDRIDSVVSQKYPIYELIILDDKSPDNSVEVINEKIKELKETHKDLKIKFVLNKENSGNVFKQWAKAFKEASGDYLWIAEADDLCSKYFLGTVMQGFDDDKVVISYAESNAIDENDIVFKDNLRDWIDIFGCGRWSKDYISSGKKELEEVLCINNTIANVSSVVFKNTKKIDFEKYLKEAQNYVLAGDWYFYSMVLLYGDIAYYSKSLNYHRMHSGSVTHTTDNFVHYNEILKIQENIKKNVTISKDVNKLIEARRKDLRANLCISDDEIYYNNISLADLVKKKNIEDDVLLSIIMPVYNTEKYLNKCFKSFVKTLPMKTEVIVINDGTKDNSEEIILKYAEEYDFIKYIKKENGGLSSVKNLGLSLAKGRYVIYIDSDDYVSSDMYSTMLKKAIDKEADMVYCDVLMVFDKTVRYCSTTNYDTDDELMQLLDGSLMAASWNKMVRKELYKDLSFPEKLNNEDVAVTPLLFLRSKKTLKISSPFYKYVQRAGSIQNSGFSNKRYMIFDTAKICFDRMKKEKYSEDIRLKVEGAVVTHQILAMLIYLIPKVEDEEERKELLREFSDRYNSLGLMKNNHYITEYIEQYNVSKVQDLIKSKDIDSLDKYLKKHKNI